MGDTDGPAQAVIDSVVAHARSSSSGPREEVEDYLRCYFGHVASSDLEARAPRELFGLAADHLQLAADWKPGTIAMQVRNPRVDTDGWESHHTVVMMVTDDLPFLVDSVIMELNRLNVGIHLVAHPVLRDQRGDGLGYGDPRVHSDVTEGAVSFMAIEVDRQSTTEDSNHIKENLLRVLGDVRAAVQDWLPMRNQMRKVAGELSSDVPLSRDEVEEGRQLLEWLADDHFIFLGYREYALTNDGGQWVLHGLPDTGLGILGGAPSSPRPGKPVADMAPAARDRVTEPRLLNLTKASSKATVHRASYLDYVGVKKFDADGHVVGERRFLGLFTSDVYTHRVTEVPLVRQVVGRVVERAGFPKGGHDEKRLLSILETYPRDELLQIDADELFDIAIGITELQERRRVRVFARRELFGRFVTCLVFLPRDRYNTASRTGIEQILVDSYGGSIADWSTRITESVLARLVFLVRVDERADREVDVRQLEQRITSLIQQWDDDFADELITHFAEDQAVALQGTYAKAFPSAYRTTFDARTAVADVHQLEALTENGAIGVSAYREPGRPPTSFKLKLYRRGDRVSLTWVMPILTNLGVTVVDERPYEIRPAAGEAVWLYDFSLEHRDTPLEFDAVAALIEQALTAIWSGRLADDEFNRLVLAAGIVPAEIRILRAYSRYIRQIGSVHSQTSIAQALEQHAPVARMLVDLFTARFDPDHDDRETTTAAITQSILDAVNDIESLDQDRIVRRFHNLITSTLRTNFFQTDTDGRPLPYLAVKLDPTSIHELPEPRPQFEIFVYSARFEGVHLRAGPVARGGLRWSDRIEDYRTEILGLVKAQMVKNAVIVPAGAKGGFVIKHLPAGADAAARRDEVVACYRGFVSGLLDLTDNLVDDDVVPPPRTVRYDSDDPYLVVAADKGTATFSDISNELAVERGFWLGDAFASGGSHGYDHKAMGITARGAWESVKRHFREFRRDAQTQDFTVVGIGDMSGDVFGNGMLQSHHTRLVAAFDHRHIFIDPDPDPAQSYDERARLFALARSSWADYDGSLISPGGGVYPRTAKTIDLSDQARVALDTDAASATPDELISVILRAPVDLLWNGGIGTYIKASDEGHHEVGDKANDTIRVDASDVRCRVIGEGGNLGVTQRGRGEYASLGGRVYTDAIDNAAGVDCSDHEVNIKILLDRVVADGDMTAKQRNELLVEMTSEVAMLVLNNNYSQTQALSTAVVGAASLVDVHARYLTSLESQGLLDRSLERLPDTDGLTERRLAGRGLTAPELAVLLACTKNTLQADLLGSSVPDDEAFLPLLRDYFPTPLRERFGDRIAGHRLRRDIVATRVANLVVDRGGTSMIYRLMQETSAPSSEIASAHMAAWAIFDLDDLATTVNALDNIMPADEQMAIHLAARQLAERATRLLLRNRPYPFRADEAIADLAEPVQETIAHLPELFVGADQTAFEARVVELTAAGTPEDLARRTAVLGPAVAALDIVEISAEVSAPVQAVAAVHFAIADALELTWLRDRILALPRDNQWSSLARLTLRGDLYTDHRRLTCQVAALAGDETDPIERVDRWLRVHALPVAYFRGTIAEIRSLATTDLTTLLIASREVRNLIGRTDSPPPG